MKWKSRPSVPLDLPVGETKLRAPWEDTASRQGDSALLQWQLCLCQGTTETIGRYMQESKGSVLPVRGLFHSGKLRVTLHWLGI